MVCFVHFHFEMCFAPQRRALFRHLNFQKWSENGVLCICSLRNVLRPTTACTFSTSQLPKAVRRWGVLNILTWKCASRHNGVQFFISHLASWLRTRRFSEPTFRPPEPQIIGKTQCFATFLPFRASASSFFLLFFLLIFLFSLPLPCSAFHLSILSEVWLLNFLRLLIFEVNMVHSHIGTSSTAQGGGGSFKNRKPIGKVGCCESGMAERSHWWIERWLMSPLFLSLSLFFSLFLYLSLIIYRPTYWSICLPIYLSTYLSVCLSIYLLIYLSYLSIYLSSHLSIYLSS